MLVPFTHFRSTRARRSDAVREACRLTVGIVMVLAVPALTACERCRDGAYSSTGATECNEDIPVKDTTPEISDLRTCARSEPQPASTTGVPIEGSVVSLCPRDFVFELAENAVLQVALEATDQGVKLALDRRGEPITEISATSSSPGRGDHNLPPGIYRATVRTNSSEPAPFRLSLLQEVYEWSEPVPDPGNDQKTAQLIELPGPGEVWQVGGLAGKDDPEDYYRLELPENGTLSFGASDVLGNIELGIHLADGIVNEATPHIYRSASSSADAFSVSVLEKGAYFLRVATSSRNAPNALYRLDLSFETYSVPQPAIEPSDEWSQALSIGSLALDPLVLGGYVGRTDAADIYYFELDQNGDLTVSLETRSAGLYAAIFDDVPLPDAADSDKRLYAEDTTQTDCFSLAQGTYYARVYPYLASADGLYTLSLSFGTTCPE
jgi:hypothetical protein